VKDTTCRCAVHQYKWHDYYQPENSEGMRHPLVITTTQKLDMSSAKNNWEGWSIATERETKVGAVKVTYYH